MKAIASALLLLCAPGALNAQQPEPDSAAAVRQGGEPFFTRSDAWLALGFAAGMLAFAPLDRQLAETMRDSSLHAHDALRTAGSTFRSLGFPGVAIIGSAAWLAGRIGKVPKLAAVGLHSVEAVGLAYVFVGSGKVLLGRARPDVSGDDPFDFGLARGLEDGDYRSFPSGHTALAFAAAAAVTAETRQLWPGAHRYVGPLLYGGAALVGASRMYHNRHWASDVVGGAAIGTLTGLKVVKYHDRNPDNPVDRWLLPAAIAPDRAGVLLVWVVPVGAARR